MRCTSDIRFRLGAEDIAKAETEISRGIGDELRYDMKAILVALPMGGYNIILHNRRERAEVRGLCDPSFVAFNAAGYTSRTSWKSVNLHVWLDPYREGWGLPTRGSRNAVLEGRANSPLGVYGVVEVKAFRKWLESTFYNLPAGGQMVTSPAQPAFHAVRVPRPAEQFGPIPSASALAGTSAVSRPHQFQHLHAAGATPSFPNDDPLQLPGSEPAPDLQLEARDQEVENAPDSAP